MKSIKLICTVLLFPILMSAQTSGLIKYTVTIKMDRQQRSNMPENVRRNIPRERKVNKELYFTPTESVFKNGERIIPEDVENGGNDRARRFRNRMMNSRTEEQTYANLETSISIMQREILGKTFLIEESEEKLTWKMTGQKKQILDYLCMEATTMINDSTALTAWFTPQIPISIGPDNLRGLPGAILEAASDNGQLAISVSSIELGAVDEEKIQAPSKGKKVTQEEFDQIRKEKMKEMRAQRGGNGRRFSRG